jgi:acetyl-CoA C-acetyltransferase
VFLHAGADANYTDFVSNRDNLHSSPAIRTAGAAALELAGLTADDLAHVDLYSCFPAAVQVAALELGLGLDRQLTVTGGMTFAGGPWNNYTMHGIATMAGVLRDDPGSLGLCTANGGYLTKHSFGVYSTSPPAAGAFRWRSTQAEVDAMPSRQVDDAPDGPAEIETYTVMHGRDGEPEQGLTALRMPDGRRAWGVTTDTDTMAAMTVEEMIGRKATVTPEGALELD